MAAPNPAELYLTGTSNTPFHGPSAPARPLLGLFDPDASQHGQSELSGGVHSPAFMTLASQLAWSFMQRSMTPQAQKSSAAYEATIRRDCVQQMLHHLDSLARHSAREDFVVCVFPLVEATRQSLDRLAEARHEGNTREILRARSRHAP